jgi:hypothetical protein
MFLQLLLHDDSPSCKTLHRYHPPSSSLLYRLPHLQTRPGTSPLSLSFLTRWIPCDFRFSATIDFLKQVRKSAIFEILKQFLKFAILEFLKLLLKFAIFDFLQQCQICSIFDFLKQFLKSAMFTTITHRTNLRLDAGTTETHPGPPETI